MDTGVPCSPCTLAQDLEMMEGILMAQLLWFPVSQVARVRCLKKPAFTFSLSLLRLVKEMKGWWQICMLNEFVNRLHVKTLPSSVSGHCMAPPQPWLYRINPWVKRSEWIFTISQILNIYVPLYFISASFFFLAMHLHFCVLTVWTHFFLIFKQSPR